MNKFYKLKIYRGSELEKTIITNNKFAAKITGENLVEMLNKYSTLQWKYFIIEED
jgi:hypothetical protein